MSWSTRVFSPIRSNFILLYRFIKGAWISTEGHYEEDESFCHQEQSVWEFTYFKVTDEKMRHMKLNDFSGSLGFGRSRMWTQEPRLLALHDSASLPADWKWENQILRMSV